MTNEINHYDWLDANFPKFLTDLGGNWDSCPGIISAHGDKAYSYRHDWEDNNIPFPHGVAIFLLTYLKPWSEEVREVGDEWVKVDKWVIENYHRFKDHLPEVKPPLIIETCQRANDHKPNGDPRWHAQIKDRPELWAAGDTPREAIGDLVATHHAHFNVRIDYINPAQQR